MNRTFTTSLQYNTLYYLTKKTIKLLLILLLLFCMPACLLSQNLDDFRSAAAGDGVNLIPYPDLRTAAKALDDDVQLKKTGVQGFSYEILESQKNNLLKEIQKKTAEIGKIREVIESYKNGVAEVSFTCMEEDIKKREAAITDVNNKITEFNAKLQQASDAFGNLAAARAKLREHFDKVVKQLADSKSSPNKHLGETPSDEDKKKFDNYISVIEDQIESQVATHKEQEDGAKGTKDKFDLLIKKAAL